MNRYRSGQRPTSPTGTSSTSGAGPPIGPVGSILHRQQRRRRPENELVQLDELKPPRQNLEEILRHVVLADISVVSKAQRLAYLSCYVKFCSKLGKRINDEELIGFSLDEIFQCLRIPLFHESAEIRASALRAMRCTLEIGRRPAAAAFQRLNIHLLVARSLDIVLDNRLERIQAMRLVRVFLSITQTCIPAMVRPLVAIARDGMGERDYLTRTAWATLCELTLLDCDLALDYGAVSCLFDCVLSALNAPISILESMLATLLSLVNWPTTRAELFKRSMSLSLFLGPLTDCNYSLPVTVLIRPGNQDAASEADEIREQRLEANRNTLVCLLRSWEGMILLSECNTNSCGHDNGGHGLWRSVIHTTPMGSRSINGIQSIVQMLYQPYRELRKTIMDMLYELFVIPMPDLACDDLSASSGSVRVGQTTGVNEESEAQWYATHLKRSSQHGDVLHDSHIPEDWQLFNSFVAGEAKSVLPLPPSTGGPGRSQQSTSSRVDLIGNYVAILLLVFLESGLMDALTHLVLIDSDLPVGSSLNSHLSSTTNSSSNLSARVKKQYMLDRIQATVLLAELLQLSIRYLPLDLVHKYHPLPRLIAFACSLDRYETGQRDLAKSAISHLKAIHTSKLDPLGNCSIYLDQQLRFTHQKNQRVSSLSDSIFNETESEATNTTHSSSLDQSIRSSSQQLTAASNHIASTSTEPAHTSSSKPRPISQVEPSPSSQSIVTTTGDLQPTASGSKSTSLPREILHGVKKSESSDRIVKSAEKSHKRGNSFRKQVKKVMRRESERVTDRVTYYLGFGKPRLKGSQSNPLDTSSSQKPYPRLEPDVSRLEKSIRQSHVNSTDNYDTWDWQLILTILSWTLSVDQNSRKALFTTSEVSKEYDQFIKRLVQFLKPTSKQFAYIELTHVERRQMISTALGLIDYLLNSSEELHSRLLDELVSDIALALSQISMTGNNLAILGPSRLSSYMSQVYFLLIGHISSYEECGSKLLEKIGIWAKYTELIDLSPASHHGHDDLLVKLVISTLDYSYETAYARVLLKKVLTCNNLSARLYGLQWCRALFRLQGGERWSKWGLHLVVERLEDYSPSVIHAAIQLLDEMSTCEHCLVELIRTNPPLFHHGDHAGLVVIRFLAHPLGLEALNKSGFLAQEVDKWSHPGGMCYRYAKLVDFLCESQSTHAQGDDGLYRRPAERWSSLDPKYLPPHLYGELAKSQDGIQLILKYDLISPFYPLIGRPSFASYKDVMQLKAAIWAVCHIGSTRFGVSLVQDFIPELVFIASSSPVISVRSTAFYGLCLLSATPTGAQLVQYFGWEPIRQLSDCQLQIVENHITSKQQNGESTGKEDKRRTITTTTWSLSSLTSTLPPSVEHDPSILSAKEMTPGNDSILADNALDDGIHLTVDDAEEADAEVERVHNKQNLLVNGIDEEPGTLRLKRVLTDGKGSSETITPLNISPSKTVTMNPDGSRQQSASSLTHQRMMDEKFKWRKYSTDSAHHQSGLHPHHVTIVKSGSKSGSSSYMYTRQTSVGSVASSAGGTHTPLGHHSGSASSHHHYHGHVSASDAKGYAELKIITEPRSTPIQKRVHSKSICETYDELSSSPLGVMYESDHKSHASDHNKPARAVNTRRRLISSTSSSHTPDPDLAEQQKQDGKEKAADSKPSAEIKPNQDYNLLVIPVDMSLIASHLYPPELLTTACPFAKPLECQNTKQDVGQTWKTHLERDSRPSFLVNDGLELHTTQFCLACHKVNPADEVTGSLDLSTGDNSKDLTPRLLTRTPSLHSISEHTAVTSPQATTTMGGAQGEKLHADPSIHQALVRKEILRYISSLSGSVAAKPAEQQLLNLKRKFPDLFKDLCTYSEVCLQLADSNFRILARRFLQEIFDISDIDNRQLIEDAERMLASKAAANANQAHHDSSAKTSSGHGTCTGGGAPLSQ